MTAPAGTAQLLRLAWRRSRIFLVGWTLGIAGTVVLTASSVMDLYPTRADRVRFAETFGDNAAVIAIRGPAQALDTVGGSIVWQVGWFAAVLTAVMSILLVGRMLRRDEETGRTELVLAAPVSRHAPLAAALVTVVAANAGVAVLTTLGLLALGLPAAGTIVFGLGLASLGLTFAAVAAVTNQLAESARAADGLAAAALGAAYMLRAVGDVNDGTLSWLSPIGWMQASRPFAGERPAVLLLAAATAVAGAVAARALLDRRDHGTGVLRTRPGPPHASAALRHPLGLAGRLQRGMLLGWGAGLLAIATAYGSLGGNVGDLLEANEQLRDIVSERGGGGDVTDAFYATAALMLALLATGFAVQSVLRLADEEASGRAEMTLAGAISRIRWAVSHVVVALAGGTLLLAAGGLVMGVVAGRVGPLAGATLVFAPAVWVLAGLALALYGIRPRTTSVAWAAVGVCFVLGLFGPLLGLPQAISDLSPFAHVPQLPGHALDVGPLVTMTAVAAALAAVGLASLRRRDLL